jgi:hypothetical protein
MKNLAGLDRMPWGMSSSFCMRGTSFMSGIRTQHATGGTTMHISKNCAIVI